MSKAFYTVAQYLQTACATGCKKVVVIPGYPFGPDWAMAKYQETLQHILLSTIVQGILHCCTEFRNSMHHGV